MAEAEAITRSIVMLGSLGQLLRATVSQSARGEQVFSRAAIARLMKTYAMQMEVLGRLRNGGQQFVRVEHVHINHGGQAVIGNVKKPDR